MSTHMPGLRSFSRYLHHFLLAELATCSIRFKMLILAPILANHYHLTVWMYPVWYYVLLSTILSCICVYYIIVSVIYFILPMDNHYRWQLLFAFLKICISVKMTQKCSNFKDVYITFMSLLICMWMFFAFFICKFLPLCFTFFWSWFYFCSQTISWNYTYDYFSTF